jgi:hypothetical protein
MKPPKSLTVLLFAVLMMVTYIPITGVGLVQLFYP